jgi:uncharacterized protein (DUF1778 family)
LTLSGGKYTLIRMVSKTARSEKLDLRLTPSAKQKLQAAARQKERSLTDFVVQSALDKADEILADQRVFFMNEAQWEKFQAALDAPPKDIPALRKLMMEPSTVEASQKK